MARLIGPDSGDRLAIRRGGSGYARNAAVVVYAAASGGTLADILNEDGGAVSGSTLTTDDFGLIPLFQFPDGLDTVYVEVAGGPRTAVYARYDDRVDGLAARVATLEGGGSSQPLNANLTTIAAISSTTAGALVTDGSGWIRKTYAQLKTALGLVKADVGLGNVDNTADTAKPISTATQSALDLKLSIAAASGAYVPFAEAVNTVASSGAAKTIPDSATASLNDITLTANCTLTLPSPAAGKSFAVLVRQDATGFRTLAWSGTIIWDGGTAPAQSTAASSITEYVFISYSGTNWRGKLAGSYAT